MLGKASHLISFPQLVQKIQQYMCTHVKILNILPVWRKNTMIYQTNKIGYFVFA